MATSVKCLIIGSGPAGYTAAIYASRANLAPVVIEGMQQGGQLITTTEIENFPGYPQGITGQAMMDDLRAQAGRFGAQLTAGIVKDIDTTKRPFLVTATSGEYLADTVIIATGATAKYLGLPDEQKYMGMGVSACATCDGFFYRNRVVAVVGGGDTACEEAMYLSGLAKQVYLIVRKDYLRASKVMQQRVLNNPKIQVLFNTNTEGLGGEEILEYAKLVEFRGTPQERHYELPIDGFFLAIGHQPNTKFVEGKIDLDEQGYIVVKGAGTETNVPGIFAAGDVADPEFRQAVTAAGMGCRAAIQAERMLMMEE